MVAKNLAKIGLSMQSAHSASKSKEKPTTLRDAGNLASVIKIALAHFTVLELVREVPWTWWASSDRNNSSSTSGDSSFTDFTDFDLRCFGIGFYDSFWISAACAPALIAFAVLFGAAYGVKGKHFVSLDVDHLAGIFVETAMTAFGVLNYVFIPSIIAQMFRMFPCFRLDNDDLMAYHPVDDCGPVFHIAMSCLFALAYSAIMCYVILWHLYQNQDKLEEPAVRARYGFFYKSYRTDCYYWSLLLVLRRLLLEVVAIMAPVSYRLGLRSAFGIVIVTSFLGIQVKFSPFEYKYMNSLETAALFVGVLTLASATTIYMANTNPVDGGNSADVATAVAVVSNALLGKSHATTTNTQC